MDEHENEQEIRRVNERLSTFLNEKKNGGNAVSIPAAFAKMLHKLDRLPTQQELDRAYLHEAMRRAVGNQKKAALLIGITPQALCSRLKKYPEPGKEN